MTAMVDSYPRTTADIPPFYPEDPGDVVKSKPSAFSTQTSVPEAEGSQASAVTSPPHNRVTSQPQIPTTPTSVKRKSSPAPLLARQESEIQVLSNGQDAFEDSTAAILRHYTPERNGRPASFHLSSSGRPREEPAMTDIFRVAGKECMVTLEDDLIKWSRRIAPGKQSGEWCLSEWRPLHVASHSKS